MAIKRTPVFDEQNLKNKISLKVATASNSENFGATVPYASQNGQDVFALSTTLPEQFIVLSVLGQGGMGTVYKCRNKYTDRLVAIKMLHGKCDPLTEKRFQQEAKAACAVIHENAVIVHDFGITSSGNPYLVMEHLEGESLSNVVEETGVLPEKFVAQIFIDACSALEAAHDIGVIHRDIKPSNLVLVNNKENRLAVKVLDFGIAKILGDESSQALTKTGEVFGSPLYMSPEQCAGNNTDLRSDIYSVGVSMYECLMGTPPHVGTNPLQTIFKRATEDPPAFKHIRPDLKISSRLESIVMKSLERDPAKRYASVADLKRDLTKFLSDLASEAVPARSHRHEAKEASHQQTDGEPTVQSNHNSGPSSLGKNDYKVPNSKGVQSGASGGNGINKWLVLLCVFVVTIFGGGAFVYMQHQNMAPDSVQPALEVDNFLTAARKASSEKRYRLAAMKYKEAISLSLKYGVGSKEELTDHYWRQSEDYVKACDNANAESALQSAISTAEGLHHRKLTAVMYMRLAQMLCNAEAYSRCIAPCLTTIKLSENDPTCLSLIVNANHQLGRAYFAMKNWPELEKVSLHQVSIEKALADPAQSFLFGYADYCLGHCDLHKHDYKSAIQHFSTAISVFKLLSTPLGKTSYIDAQAGLDAAKHALGISDTSTE
jgi:serine/threonine protein kinase